MIRRPSLALAVRAVAVAVAAACLDAPAARAAPAAPAAPAARAAADPSAARAAASPDGAPRARTPPPDRPDAGDARAGARRLLAEERFQEPSVPRPLRGVLLWLGALIAPLVEAVTDAVDALAALVPGGRPVGLTLLAGAALLAFAALASRSLRLRARRRETAVAHARERARGPSPTELERAAADAERSGDLDLAVRLRFRAGLLALERQGTIALHPSLTTAAIARRLASREFAAVASGFEQVAYGGRSAAAADVDAQRAGWPKVLEEAGG